MPDVCAAATLHRPSCNTAPIPNFKFDQNNCGPVSSDLITAEYTNSSWRNLTSWAWPAADYPTRREIWKVRALIDGKPSSPIARCTMPAPHPQPPCEM